MLDSLYAFARRISPAFLRVSLAVILAWIGSLKFADPAPVRGLLEASLPFLASNTFVYVVGVLELLTAALLVANVAVRYIGFLTMALFAGTLTIFVVAPAVSYGAAGFPFLSLTGQFLLKDLALLAGTVSIIATDSAKMASRRMVPTMAMERSKEMPGRAA